jgi:hypothetical protein
VASHQLFHHQGGIHHVISHQLLHQHGGFNQVENNKFLLVVDWMRHMDRVIIILLIFLGIISCDETC